MNTLAGKTLLITGASRGIGKAIALRAARDGANIIVAAKTETPHARLPGTIHDAAAEIAAVGGRAVAVRVDVRDESTIAAAVAQGVEAFGGIDIVVNNASAISLTGTADTEMKRFDLMMSVNVRGTFAVTRACLPFLKQAANPHILVMGPPPSLAPHWFAPHAAYTISKMAMSLCVLGWADEFRVDGIAANALWPRTLIDTAAMSMVGAIRPDQCRRPEIVADAAHAILTRPSRECTGRFFIDEDALREAGKTDLAAYAVAPGGRLLTDLFVEGE
jgi:citronellol/citronellal dehydrogenase